MRERGSRRCRGVLGGPDERLDRALSLIESAAKHCAASGPRRDAPADNRELEVQSSGEPDRPWRGRVTSDRCTWPDLSHSTQRGCKYPWGDRTTRSAPAAGHRHGDRSRARRNGGPQLAAITCGAPALPHGSTGEHTGFPSTRSLRLGSCRHRVGDAADHFEGVVLVSSAAPSSRSRASSSPRRSQGRSRGSPTRRLTPSRVRPSRSTAGSPCSDGRQGHSASGPSSVVEASG